MALRSTLHLTLIFAVLMASFSLVAVSGPNASAATITVGPAGQYQSVQEAIDASSPGDTVEIASGTFVGNLLVNKSINLEGDGIGSTVIMGDGTDSVITVESDWVNISGMKVTTGGMNGMDAGILLPGVYNCTVSNVTVTGCRFGLFLTASGGNRIFNCNFINNTRNAYDDGINTWSLRLPAGGNFWDDMELEDENGDGVMDRAYAIPGGTNTDHKPWAGNSGWLGYEHELSFEVDAVTILFVGMGVVFAILTILWISTELTGVLIQRYGAGNGKSGGQAAETDKVAAIAAAIETRRD